MPNVDKSKPKSGGIIDQLLDFLFKKIVELKTSKNEKAIKNIQIKLQGIKQDLQSLY